MKKYQLGVALGGGGARGFAHLGVLKGLQEKGMYPDAIAGVSAGALAGVFIAAGKSPQETMHLMKANNITDYARVTMPVNGLLNFGNLEEILKEHIGKERIEALELPFYIGVTNLQEGKSEYVNKGNLISYVQASASIPVLFSPVAIEGTQYVDGGLMDNLPVTPLEEQCEHIIAVSISPTQRVDHIENLMEMATRVFQLSVNNQYETVQEISDLFIEPKGLDAFGLLDTSNADELFRLGYEAVQQVDEKRLAALQA